MPLYHWQGIDKQGSTHEGRTFSSSLSDLKQQLNRRSIGLLHARKSLIAPRLSQTQKNTFYAHLAALLQAHVPLYEALCAMKAAQHSELLQALLEDMAVQVSEGRSFLEILKEHQLVDPLAQALILVGEETGTLGPLLEHLVAYQREAAASAARLKQALLLPLVTLGFFMVVFGGMLIFVVPQFGEYFKAYEVELPVITQMLMALSDTLVSSLLMVVAGILSVVLSIKGALYTTRGQWLKDSLLRWMPFVNEEMKMRAQARILKVLGLLVTHHVPLSEALQACVAMISHHVYKRGLEDMKIAVDSGVSFATAWHDSCFHSQEIEALLSLGETSGRLGDMMLHASELIEKRVYTRLQRMSALASPLLLLVIALLIGGLMWAIYIPLISLSASFS